MPPTQCFQPPFFYVFNLLLLCRHVIITYRSQELQEIGLHGLPPVRTHLSGISCDASRKADALSMDC